VRQEVRISWVDHRLVAAVVVCDGEEKQIHLVCQQQEEEAEEVMVDKGEMFERVAGIVVVGHYKKVEKVVDVEDTGRVAAAVVVED
jgi:hypothetical protein